MKQLRCIFIPGNGGGTPQDNWFPSIGNELEKLGVEIITREFPDNILAREKYWVPFLLNELKVDENTILIGHSSGAIAAMRVAEQTKIYGSVLVGAYHSDLGIEAEKQAGYFDRPWNFQAIAANQKWVMIFASVDDPWIPIEEARYLKDQLVAEYHEFTNQGHFGGDYFKTEFPELAHALRTRLE